MLAAPTPVLQVLTPRDTATGLLNVGGNEAYTASLLDLPCRFAVDVDDTGDASTTFYGDGVIVLAKTLAAVRDAVASALLSSGTPPLRLRPLRFSVRSAEGVAALMAALGSGPSAFLSPPLPEATLEIGTEPMTFLATGAGGVGGWDSVWATVAALRPLMNVTAVALDVTAALGVTGDVTGAQASLMAFMASAADHRVGVEFVLGNPTWALAPHHATVRMGGPMRGAGAGLGGALVGVTLQRALATASTRRRRTGR